MVDGTLMIASGSHGKFVSCLDLVQPAHGHAIGLVVSDREPLPPMAGALAASLAGADVEADPAAVPRAA